MRRDRKGVCIAKCFEAATWRGVAWRVFLDLVMAEDKKL